MDTVEIARTRRPVSSNMDTQSDERLLEEVAQRRSEAAFSAMYRRYSGPAFSLAFYLTKNRAEAEDAVQEAMLDLWSSASAYQEGNVRGWIMSIVAHKSLNRLKKKRRAEGHAREMQENQAGTPSVSEPLPVEAAERSELVSAMRGLLEGLSDDDRRLVALYYGVGFTYEQVGAELSMPVQTVAFRIKRVLAGLNTSLSKAGFAAVAPLLESQRLQETLISGYEAPPHLADAVLRRVAQSAGRTAASLSRRAAAAPSGTKPLVWLAVGLAALAVGGSWWFFRSPPSDAGQPLLQAQAELPPQPNPAAEKSNAWQPVPIEPHAEFRVVIRGVEQLKQPSARDGKFYTAKANYEHIAVSDLWVLRTSPQGAELRCLRLEPKELCLVYPGDFVSGAREWTGRLEYQEDLPEGELYFDVQNVKMASRMFGRHKASGAACTFRLVAWPFRDQVRVVSFRTLKSGQVYQGTEHVTTENGQYRIGFGASARVLIRELRYRKLPEGWRPEDDAELKPSIQEGDFQKQ